MKLSDDDKKLLAELCSQHRVCFDKVINLLDTERDFEFKERRTGIYDALREIVNSSSTEESKA
ncbi:DNA modification system-associated small protein [Photobacterium leiognathi]|uniref:DNA modification system-associated small protein n=1 Tax=Photobacterium leiognathi TaxID=553611 RepID=UPI002982B1D0|nr:DNA modification system-associated small protein [Photobacterium leiognathi]